MKVVELGDAGGRDWVVKRPARGPLTLSLSRWERGERFMRLVGVFVAALIGASSSALAQSGDPDLRGFDAVPNKATPLQRGGIGLEGSDPSPG